MSTTTSTDILEEMTRRIVERFHPQRIVLFGSRARGTQRSSSDYDLLIIAPSAEPDWRRTAPVYRMLKGMNVTKDIVWLTPEEIARWQHLKGHFVYTVLHEGKELYVSRN
jgi:predicted nucleotidyltransferase